MNEIIFIVKESEGVYEGNRHRFLYSNFTTWRHHPDMQ